MKKRKSKKYTLRNKKRRSNLRKNRKIKKTRRRKQSGGSLFVKSKIFTSIPENNMINLNPTEDEIASGYETLSKDDQFKLQLMRFAFKVDSEYPESKDKCKLYMLFSFLPPKLRIVYPFHPSFVLTGVAKRGEMMTKDISVENNAYQGVDVPGIDNLQSSQTGDMSEPVINSKNFTLDLDGTNEALVYFGYFKDDKKAQEFSEKVASKEEDGYSGFQKPYNVLKNNCQHYASYALELLKTGYYNFESAISQGANKMIDIDLKQLPDF